MHSSFGPAKLVLVVGSAPDALRARAWSKSLFDSLVVINNAWRVRDDWDILVHAGDFPSDRMPSLDSASARTIITPAEYVPAQNRYGGFVYAGPTMAFTAAYWIVDALRPDYLLFLGCDMNYDARAGQTHFYGNGAADPLRADKTLKNLGAKSARLFIQALKQGTLCLNLSENPISKLKFPRLSEHFLAELRAQPTFNMRAVLRDAIDWDAVDRALSRERELEYFVPDGRYWRHLDSFDEKELDAIDALWLSSFAKLPLAPFAVQDHEPIRI